LTAKIVLVLLAVTVSFSLVNIGISWKSSIDILYADRAESEKRLVFLGGKNLETYFGQMDLLLLSPYLTTNFMVNLGQKSLDYYGNAQNEAVLKALLFSNPEIEYLYFFNNRGSVLYSQSKQTSAYSPFPEGKYLDWIIDALKSPDGLAIQKPGSFVNLKGIGTVTTEPVFLMSRRIFDIETNEPLAVLALAISVTTIQGILDKIRTGKETLGVFIGGKEFYLNSGELGLKETLTAEIRAMKTEPGQVVQKIQGVENASFLFTSIQLPHGIRIVKAVPFSLIQASAANALGINLISLILSTSLLLLVIALTVYPMLRPLRRLALAMAKVGTGDFQLDPLDTGDSRRTDEIAILNRGFRTMVTDLNHHIDQEFKARIEIQEAQLRALQAQINPHFLYNTIQSIGALALRKDAIEIYDVTLALASILRYALRPVNEHSTLREEVDYVSKYLEIQKLRFEDRLCVHWKVEDAELDTPVPRLLIQPLVENAILHNLERSRQALVLIIEIHGTLDFAEVFIQDNGVGMPEASVQSLRNEIVENAGTLRESRQIGIRNVSERLRIFTSGQGSLTMDSPEGGGMVFRIRLPKGH